MNGKKVRFIILLVCLLILLTLFLACKQKSKGAPPPPEVAFVEIKPQKVTLYSELPARVNAFLVAEVRPQVSGIIQKRYFEEGDDVREGQHLYLIDPAPFQAAYDNAKAALLRAEANILSAKNRYERYKELIKTKAISQQEFDDAESVYKQSEAEIEFYKAGLTSAEINLKYATVTAPISGRIGKSNVTVGALVTQGQPYPLTTIQDIKKVYVDATRSSTEMLELRRKLEAGHLQKDEQTNVILVLEDGSDYPDSGTFKFSDVTVDESTGSVILRSVFENKDKILLPGMFVRIKIEEGKVGNALLVPQRGVTRDPKGAPYIMAINAENKVEQKFISVDRTIGNNWLVTGGVNENEKVVVEGLDRAKDGIEVKPVPFEEKKEN